MGAFGKMHQNYSKRDLAAREWKKKGGKVAGYVCNDVPEEMILAAGLFPYRISGNPDSGTETADRYAEVSYEPDVRSMFNMLLTGQYDFLDFLIIPHSRYSVLQMYYHLQNVREIEPSMKLPDFYLLDTLHTKFWQTGQYVRDRMLDLKKKLEEWSGQEITNEKLSRAIATVNKNRALLKKVADLRGEVPSRISGMEALQIIGSSMLMPKEEHNKLLAQFLAEVDRLPARNGMRLFAMGSPLDNLQFYDIAESTGVTIVGEDSCWGNGHAGDPIEASLDPVEAIAEWYHLKVPCSRMDSISRRVENTVQRVLEAGAQGVIFFFLEWDTAPAWEYPDQKKALEDRGIATISFEMQKYRFSDNDREHIKGRLEEFVRSIGKANNG